MVVTVVSTVAQLNAAYLAANDGDVIQLAAGTIWSSPWSTPGRNVAVTITQENISNPAELRNSALSFTTHVQNLTLDGLRFRGTQTQPPYTLNAGNQGLVYPNSSQPIFAQRHTNVTIKNCDFDYYAIGPTFRGGTGLRITRNAFRRFRMDAFRLYNATSNGEYSYNAVYDPLVDPTQINLGSQHPDAIQFATNDSPEVAHTNWHIHHNFVDDEDGLMNGFMIAKDNSTLTRCYEGFLIEFNYVRTGRFIGITITRGYNSTIRNNLIRFSKFPQGASALPAIRTNERMEDMTVRDNVAPNFSLQATPVGTNVLTDNIESQLASVVPPSWVTLAPGVNVGPYTEGGTVPVPPAQPTNDATDGKIGTYYEPADKPGRYAGVLIVPLGAPARAALQNAAKFRWRNPTKGITTYQPFRIGTPSANSAGSWRFEMQGATTDSVFTVGPLEVESGVVWGWQKADGDLWSADSSFTGGFTAPALPPPPALTALTTGDWSIPNVVEVSPGFYTGEIVVTSVVPSAVEWTIPGAPWMTTANAGVDGNGRVRWRLRGSDPGGQEHLAGFDEMIGDIRARYYFGDGVSPTSTTGKSFTAPTAPPQDIAAFTPLLIETLIAMLDGRRWVMASPDRPAIVAGRTKEMLQDGPTSFTLNLPSSPPVGADSIHVRYAGALYRQEGGPVTINKVAGHTAVTVRGHSAMRGPGVSRRFLVSAL